MGVYVAEPEVLDYIEAGSFLDVPELVLRLLDNGERVGSFLYEGYWLDIGRHEDYERAIVEYEQLKHQLFGDFEVEIASSGAAAVAAPDTG